MKQKRCLYCYNLLETDGPDFHPACSKKIFGKPVAPELPYSDKELAELGLRIIQSHTAVTGAQVKVSLGLEKGDDSKTPMRLTIVGLLGLYILKPQTRLFRNLPEVEDASMHLAEICQIATVPHSLIKMKSGNLAYITRRIDRENGNKIHMEDMCQLTERLTEHKYQGSHEQIGQVIAHYSSNPGLDLVNYYEQLLFAFLTGNADMHLKNYSLIDQPGIGYTLSPAYDLVSTALVMPSDKEELALNLNGKKKNLKRKDFIAAMSGNGIPEKTQQNTLNKLAAAIPSMLELISKSFLSVEMQHKYSRIIESRARQLGL